MSSIGYHRNLHRYILKVVPDRPFTLQELMAALSSHRIRAGSGYEKDYGDSQYFPSTGTVVRQLRALGYMKIDRTHWGLRPTLATTNKESVRT